MTAERLRQAASRLDTMAGECVEHGPVAVIVGGRYAATAALLRAVAEASPCECYRSDGVLYAYSYCVWHNRPSSEDWASGRVSFTALALADTILGPEPPSSNMTSASVGDASPACECGQPTRAGRHGAVCLWDGYDDD